MSADEILLYNVGVLVGCVRGLCSCTTVVGYMSPKPTVVVETRDHLRLWRGFKV